MRVHILSYRANTVFMPHLIGEDSQNMYTGHIVARRLTEGKSASRSRIPSEAALFSRRLLVVDHSPRRKHASTQFCGALNRFEKYGKEIINDRNGRWEL